MWLASEYGDYASERKTLRVSNINGEQRQLSRLGRVRQVFFEVPALCNDEGRKAYRANGSPRIDRIRGLDLLKQQYLDIEDLHQQRLVL